MVVANTINDKAIPESFVVHDVVEKDTVPSTATTSATPSDEENSADGRTPEKNADSSKTLSTNNDQSSSGVTPTSITTSPVATTTTTANTSSWFCFGNSKADVPKCGRDLGVHERCLEDRANCLSRWLLCFMNPLLKLGSMKILDEDDIGVPPKQDVASTAYNNSLQVWNTMAEKCRTSNAKLLQNYETKLAKCKNEKERQKVKEPIYKEPSIALALIKAFGPFELCIGLVYYVMSALLTFVPVLILNDLLKFFQSGLSAQEYDGLAHPWVEVVGLGVIPFFVSLLQTRHQTIYAHCAVFVRTAVSTMLYRKALRVSAAGRAKTSTGQVVNMMSNDTAQLQRFLQFVGMTIVAPVQIILALVLIYFQVRLLC